MNRDPVRVLIIEDDLQCSRLIEKMLDNKDVAYECSFAGSLGAGLERLKSRAFDVILLDLGLPDSEGMDTLARARGNSNSVPIIVLTGLYDEEMAVKAFELGAAEYFFKQNTDKNSLRRAIRYAMERARSHKKIMESKERLRRLSRRLVEAQEQERRRIARELHDEVGQALTALDVKLEMASQGGHPGAEIKASRDLVRDLMKRVRSISLDLRPTMLDDLGLLSALLWHFDRFTEQTGVRIDFKHSRLGSYPLGAEVETAAFRIVQEALTNVARHAGVGEVKARFVCDKEMLCFEVSDDGVGFDAASAVVSSACIGLSSMQERAELLGGRVEVTASPGAGTRVSAELPLDLKGGSREEP